jgi:dTDP-4-dehydrorhamnose 3,5-epimerase
LYKVTNYWDPSSEQRIIWNDSTLDINWQLPQGVTPSLNPKDAQGKTWEEAIKFA